MSKMSHGGFCTRVDATECAAKASVCAIIERASARNQEASGGNFFTRKKAARICSFNTTRALPLTCQTPYLCLPAMFPLLPTSFSRSNKEHDVPRALFCVVNRCWAGCTWSVSIFGAIYFSRLTNALQHNANPCFFLLRLLLVAGLLPASCPLTIPIAKPERDGTHPPARDFTAKSLSVAVFLLLLVKRQRALGSQERRGAEKGV